jgi:hypothetical protein
MDAPTPAPVVPPHLVVPLPLTFPLAELMSRVIVPPLGVTIPLTIKHNWQTNIVATFHPNLMVTHELMIIIHR